MSTATSEAPEAAARASSSSFYAAMRIMPPAQRDAMFEIYSFCRVVDDIADDGGPRDVRLEQLQRYRTDIDAIYAGAGRRRIWRGLAKAVHAFDLRREDFIAIIDGMEMDVVSTLRAPDLATLDLYCDRVASAVGRLSVRVFGMEREAGVALAYHLGRALQLTNILRDLDEDAAIGRLYLPREALRDAGIAVSDPVTILSDPAIGKACAPVVERARQHFAQAEKIMAKSPRRTVKTPRIMAAAYRMMLDRDDRARLAGAAHAGEAAQAAIRLDPAPLRPRVMPGTTHVIGAGLAGLSAAVRLASAGKRVALYEATSQAGGRCRSYHDPALDLDHRQRQSPRPVGQSRGACLSRHDRRARPAGRTRDGASFPSSTLPPASDGRSARTAAAFPGGYSRAIGASRHAPA